MNFLKKIVAKILHFFHYLYDPLINLFFKDEKGFRKKLVDLAQVKENERVLDVVFTSLIHHLLFDYESEIAISEISRILKKNGRYVSCEWKKFGFPKEVLLKHGFKIEKTEEIKAKELLRIPVTKFDSVLILARKK